MTDPLDPIPTSFDETNSRDGLDLGGNPGLDGLPEDELIRVEVWPARFKDRRFLGKGGMGAVYSAFDEKVKRRVALKMARPVKAKDRERFLREARFAAQVRHANVLAVHEVLDLQETLLLVSELVPDARTLDEAWSELSLPQRVDLLIQTSRGIEAIHAAGILHRDLKPENVLVGSDGRALVADFGIAYSDELERLTQTGAAVGTPAFMSPEQAGTRTKPTPATDVWGLGALLFIALTDELPFQGGSLIELLSRIATGLGREHAALLEPAPRQLRGLVYRALEPDPGRRIGTAREFREALEAYRYAPRTASERATRRMPLVLGVSLLLAVAALVGVTLGGAPAPEVVATPTPTATLSASGELDRASRELESADPLVRYLAAIQLRGSGGARADRAAEVLRRQGREALIVVAAQTPMGWLDPSGGSIFVREPHRVWQWVAGAETWSRSLPFAPHLREELVPQGHGMFAHSEWRQGSSGLLRVSPGGRLDWLLGRGRERVTAAGALPRGEIAVGLEEELRIYSADMELLASASLEGETPQWLAPRKEGLLVLSATPPGTRAGFSHLRFFSRDLDSEKLLARLPGRRVLPVLDGARKRALFVNSTFGSLSLLDLETKEERQVLSPASILAELGEMSAGCWSATEEEALVFFQDGELSGRIDAWDLGVDNHRSWSRELRGALSCTFASSGNLAVVGFKDELRVYGLALEAR